MNGSGSIRDPRGELYAGSQTCMDCHAQQIAAHKNNPHSQTSARFKHLPGPLKAPFLFGDSSIIGIETRDTITYQAHHIDNAPTESQSFDITFGAGEKAQTYAYWKEDTLFELPLSWYRAAEQSSWAVSPGFNGYHPNFKRVIASRCFECHASYIGRQSVQTGSVSVTEILDRNTIVYGIDCERCHGPAAQHVKFQRENPGVTTARFMVSIKSLSRQQQLDQCAVCHSGNDQSTQRSLFDFTPGDTLGNFLIPDFGGLAAGEPDVHGKQFQLLQRSACFQGTQMTCNTCHSQHKTEAIETQCRSCHPSPKHSSSMTITTSTCIDCHMPLQPSRLIQFSSGAGQRNIPYLIRTHRIGIYATQSHQK